MRLPAIFLFLLYHSSSTQTSGLFYKRGKRAKKQINPISVARRLQWVNAGCVSTEKQATADSPMSGWRNGGRHIPEALSQLTWSTWVPCSVRNPSSEFKVQSSCRRHLRWFSALQVHRHTSHPMKNTSSPSFLLPCPCLSVDDLQFCNLVS